VFMEKAVNAKYYAPTAASPGDFWWDDTGWTCNSYDPTVRVVNYQIPSVWGDTADRNVSPWTTPLNWYDPMTGKSQEWGFGSAHQGTMLSVFGDGSVHPISLNVDVDHSETDHGVLWKLSVRDDGMTVDPSSY